MVKIISYLFITISFLFVEIFVMYFDSLVLKYILIALLVAAVTYFGKVSMVGLLIVLSIYVIVVPVLILLNVNISAESIYDEIISILFYFDWISAFFVVLVVVSSYSIGVKLKLRKNKN